MIRDIFVPLLRAVTDHAALDAAVAIASAAGDAHVAALVTMESPLPIATEWGYVPAEINAQMMDEARKSAEAVAARARAHLARATVASEVRVTDALLLWGEETAAMQARYADLTVLAGPDRSAPAPRFALYFKSLLMTSGRPVLMVPGGATLQVPAKRVVVAWQPTGEAARALHDALPLLAPGAEIQVLMVDPVIAEGRHGEQPGADIATHLARHGLKVEVLAVPAQGDRVGDHLLIHARQAGADLLVMGGYGHARWREAVLGGTTRTVLDEATLPVLFAH